MANSRANDVEENISPLIGVSLYLDTFTSDWTNCDRIATYIARVVSHDRSDSLLYSNLFSSALNELMETAFRANGRTGRLQCQVLRSGRRDRIELVIPCDAEARHFYESAMVRLHADDVPEQYMEALFSRSQIDPHIGLLELAVDYKARLSIRPAPDDSICLTADFVLEDGEF